VEPIISGDVLVEYQQLRNRLSLLEREARVVRQQVREIEHAADGALTPAPVAGRVEEFLREQMPVAFSPKSVQRALGIEGSLASTMHTLAKAGRIEKVARALYRGVERPEAP